MLFNKTIRILRISLLLFVESFWVSFLIMAQTPMETQGTSATSKESASQTRDPNKTGQQATSVPNAGTNSSDHQTGIAKTDNSETNKKKAQALLNRCYQEALVTEPEVKAEALNRVAQSMGKINRERALYIFQQAFDAAGEIQAANATQRKASLQYSIVNSLATTDTEKALELALRMDRVYPTGDIPFRGVNWRNNALSFLASRIANKDPNRAFEIIQQEISEGNYEPSFMAPVALAFKKSSPDKAEQLYIEAIHQFEKPNHDVLQVHSFVDLTTRLFDLNHNLSAKALDLIIQAIDDLEKKQQEDGFSFTITSEDSKGKSSVSSIREYAAIQALAMMRRLDPERAKSMEERYAKYRDSLSRNPNGFFPIGNDSETPANTQTASKEEVDATVSGSNPSRTVIRTTASGTSGPSDTSSSTNQQSVFVVRATSGSGSPPPDPNRLAVQLQTQMQIENAVRTAQNNPAAAMNSILRIESPADRAKALARVASAVYKSDPEKAKSLLSDVYTTAEKISDSYDRAQIYGYLADGYLNFDRDRARALLTEAFTTTDKILDEEANRPTSQPFENRLPPEFRRSNQLYQQLLTSLARLNIDEAITRAEQISDKKIKLMTLINIAGFILNDGQTTPPGIRIYLN